MKLKFIIGCILFCLSINIKAQFKEALDKSPRHHEWVDLKRADGSICKAFVVYPESSKPTKSVVVIHENRGLNDWARFFADALAAKGFLVIAPDLISNTVVGIEKTTDFADSDEARKAIYALKQENVTADLFNAYNHVKMDKASTGEVAVIGFCWGGSQSFNFATANPDLSEALVFYGTAPKDAAVFTNIYAPVYGFYGGDDARVNSTIPDTESNMKANNKTFTYQIYEGAGHAFMRRGAETTDTNDANKIAHDKAWEKLLSILNKN